jgi:hypothetical protein
MLWKRSFHIEFFVLCKVAMASSTKMSNDEMKRAIRMKTTRQLKSIFQEVSMIFDETLDKMGLQDLAFETKLMEKWWQLHPEKRPETHHEQKQPAPPSGGDFSHVQDPVKRKVLESLKQKGLNIGMTGGAAMSLDALIDMDHLLGGLPPLDRDAPEEEDDEL